MQKRKRQVKGFTLIELLVVVAILVALAGLLLPKLDRVQLKANKGIAANNIHGVNRYIQSYFILHNQYSDRWDSLLDSAGKPWKATAPANDPTKADWGLDPELTGGAGASAFAAQHHKLGTTGYVLGAAGSGYVSNGGTTDDLLRSLLRVGITKIVNLDTTNAGFPGESFAAPADIDLTTKFSSLDTTDDDARAIIDKIYPDNKYAGGTSGATKKGCQLIVVGFGPANTIIGSLIDESPFYPNTNSRQYYDRFLAVFELHDDGTRAELKAVLGGDGDRLSDEITESQAL